MAAPSLIRGDQQFTDNVTFTGTTVTIPDGTIVNAKVSAAAAIVATKLVHRVPISFSQNMGQVVASETRPVYTAIAGGTIIDLQVAPITAPTGGDLQYTVDLQKSTAGGAFATVLSSVVTCSSSSTDRTVQSGTISSAAFVATDVLQIVITASGSSGTQGTGVNVTVNVDQTPA